MPSPWKRRKPKNTDILRCDRSPDGDPIRTEQDWIEHKARVRASKDEKLARWEASREAKAEALRKRG